MADNCTIAVDAMGGDEGPDVTVPASLGLLDAHPRAELILVGDEDRLRAAVDRRGGDRGGRLTYRHTSQVVEMDESASVAMRNKKDSSMRVAIDLVKEGRAQACVSAGNTGALMATARFVLKTLPGVDRPAICTTLPTTEGHVHVLDLGANVDSRSTNLFEFAVMGSVLAGAVDGQDRPSVGLLNVGEEDVKGNEVVKEAARLLGESDLAYHGFVEGNDIFQGTTDVVVCDGFVGNVMLKSTEGVARLIAGNLRAEFRRNVLTKLVGLMAKPVLNRFRSRIDPRRFNGASLVGLQGIVIKSHGNADTYAFGQALHEAILEVDKAVPDRIGRELERVLVEGRTV
jgi:glycerol-3-phosphate acyltransferase PlsX